MEILIFWLIMAGVVAVVANGKGRSAAPWFFYGLAVWPIALVHIIMKPAEATIDPSGPHRPFGEGTRVVRADDTRKCPYCAEVIKAEAIVCRFCGRDIVPASSPPRQIGESAPVLPRDPGPPPVPRLATQQRREPPPLH